MKKVQILIISSVIILVLGIVTFVALYFATDIFKSDEEMFYKYISQLNIKDLFDSNIQANYQKRKESEAYTNKGTIKIKVEEDGEAQIDEEFAFDNKIDLKNKFANSKIDLKKDDEEVLTVNYLRNEDLYGVTFTDIISQYMVFENDNLKDLAEKFGIQNVEDIPDKIDLSEITQSLNQKNINSETLKSILDKYLNIIIENIPKENYSKIENGYKLTIDVKTLQNICNKIISEVKEDKQIYELITNVLGATQELSFEQYQETIQEIISQSTILEETDENFDIINVVVDKQRKIHVRVNENSEGTQYTDLIIEKSEDLISLKLNVVEKTTYGTNEINFTITKNLNIVENENCNIKITAKEEEEVANFNITMTRNGKLDSNSIQNSIIASVEAPEDNLQISLEYNDNKSFGSNIETEEFDENNYLIINQLSKEQIENLSVNLANLISEKTGLNAGEIAGTVVVGLMSTSTLDLETMAIPAMALVSINIYVASQIELSTLANEANDEIKELFNSQFSIYEGLQKGTTVRTLLQRIATSNENTPERTVKYTNVLIDINKTYKVSFEKDAEGYINNVIIVEEQ